MIDDYDESSSFYARIKVNIGVAELSLVSMDQLNVFVQSTMS